jgi:excisionase family DNA binding protein
MDNSKHLTPEEIAEIFRVHVVTVRRWIAGGQLNAIRLPGGGYRIPQSELDRLCKSSSVEILPF